MMTTLAWTGEGWFDDGLEEGGLEEDMDESLLLDHDGLRGGKNA